MSDCICLPHAGPVLPINFSTLQDPLCKLHSLGLIWLIFLLVDESSYDTALSGTFSLHLLGPTWQIELLDSDKLKDLLLDHQSMQQVHGHLSFLVQHIPQGQPNQVSGQHHLDLLPQLLVRDELFPIEARSQVGH